MKIQVNKAVRLIESVEDEEEILKTDFKEIVVSRDEKVQLRIGRIDMSPPKYIVQYQNSETSTYRQISKFVEKETVLGLLALVLKNNYSWEENFEWREYRANFWISLARIFFVLLIVTLIVSAILWFINK